MEVVTSLSGAVTGNSTGNQDGGLNIVSAATNFATGNWLGLATDAVGALKSSTADNTKAGLQFEARHYQYKNEKTLYDNLEKLDLYLESSTEQQLQQLKVAREVELAKIKANEERKSNEIKTQREGHGKTLEKMQNDLTRQVEAQQNERIRRFMETLATKNMDVDGDREWLKMEVSEIKKAAHLAHAQHLEQRKLNGKENENLKVQLLNLEKERMNTQFDKLLRATVVKLNGEYELKKVTNEQKERAFRQELKQIRKLGLQRINQLGVMVDEQFMKIQNERGEALKNEVLKMSFLKVSLQQSKDSCVNACFGPKRPEKIDKKMREAMENLRNQLYGLASHTVVIERKMAGVEGVGDLEAQIGVMKQSNTKATEAITDYLCHHKLSDKKAEIAKTKFINSMTDLLNSIDSITVSNSASQQPKAIEIE